MVEDEIMHRLDQWRRIEGGDLAEMVDICREGGRLVFRTGRRYLRTKKANVLFCTALIAFGAIACGIIMPRYDFAFAALACMPALIGPILVRPRRLLEMDAYSGEITVCSCMPEAQSLVPAWLVVDILGRYEICGWDARAVVSCVCEFGPDIELVVLPGRDVKLAEYMCKLLGFVLDRSSHYEDTDGHVITCYEPVPT